MALLYAATYPQRTSAMVLYGAYAKRSWAPDYPFGWNDEQWQRVLNDIEQHWGTPGALTISMRVPGADQGYAERAASYLRASASPGAAAAITRMNREIDVRHVLPAHIYQLLSCIEPGTVWSTYSMPVISRIIFPERSW